MIRTYLNILLLITRFDVGSDNNNQDLGIDYVQKGKVINKM